MKTTTHIHRGMRLLLLLLALLLACTACARTDDVEYDSNQAFLEAIGFTEVPVDENSLYRLYYYSDSATLVFDDYSKFQIFYADARQNGMDRLIGIAYEKTSEDFKQIVIQNEEKEFPPYHIASVSFGFQKQIDGETIKYSFQPNRSLLRQKEELNVEEWEMVELTYKQQGADSKSMYYKVGFEDASAKFVSIAQICFYTLSLSPQEMEEICAELIQAVCWMD